MINFAQLSKNRSLEKSLYYPNDALIDGSSLIFSPQHHRRASYLGRLGQESSLLCSLLNMLQGL